ncbi:serine/threonine-protein kinase [Arthrobacter sp. E44]|uniref:serine/threonine-protein kinase n=1 Tax=Arthrobacter sp. E44 TaxID=3341794 RepID=UPI0035A59A8D
MSEGLFTGSAGVLVADRYRIDAVIGRGATASVYRARDEQLGRDVALKVFSAGNAAGPGRFEAEMRLVATFNHPALVTLYDAGTDTRVPEEPRTFLSMELINGQDLHARLRGGPLSAHDVACIGADLASALDYVHGRGIIHRDIKPANILLAETRPGTAPRPKLTDFGIARILEGPRLTATGLTVGTAAYLSPEQATGTVLGPESDIYSLGLVLLECLTGTLEYPGTSVESAVARLHRPPRIPAALGPRWDALLRAMTATEPAGRPAARDVETALRAATGSGVPAALPGNAGGVTQALAGMPDRPPRTGKQNTRTRVLIPTLPGEDAEHTAATAAPASPDPGQRRRNLPRRVAWLAGAGLTLAILVIAVVAVFHAQAPASPVPQPLPSIPGPLGQHLEQLKKSITP